MTSMTEAKPTVPFTRSTRTRRRSPGAANATIKVLPSACASPKPPGRMRSIVTSIVSQKPARQAGSTREHLAWGGIKGDLRQLPSLTVGLLTLHKKQTQPRHAEVLAHPFTHQMVACLSERCFVHVTLVRLKL